VNAAAAAQPAAVQLVTVGGRELLFYPAPQRPVVALLRGTAADAAGNISFEREPLLLSQLDQV
jgi:propionate CoA-transferase